MSKADAITKRLTDPKLYTGTHVNRFDDDGKGKGLAGRKELVNYTGSTNAKAIDQTPVAQHKPVVQPGLGQQKYGVQAAKSITVVLFRNGDKHHAGEKIMIKGFKSFDQFLDKASQQVKLPTGAVRKVYKNDLRHQIKSLDDLEDGGRYLACGGEKPIESALPQGL